MTTRPGRRDRHTPAGQVRAAAAVARDVAAAAERAKNRQDWAAITREVKGLPADAPVSVIDIFATQFLLVTFNALLALADNGEDEDGKGAAAQ